MGGLGRVLRGKRLPPARRRDRTLRRGLPGPRLRFHDVVRGSDARGARSRRGRIRQKATSMRQDHDLGRPRESHVRWRRSARKKQSARCGQILASCLGMFMRPVGAFRFRPPGDGRRCGGSCWSLSRSVPAPQPQTGSPEERTARPTAIVVERDIAFAILHRNPGTAGPRGCQGPDDRRHRPTGQSTGGAASCSAIASAIRGSVRLAASSTALPSASSPTAHRRRKQVHPPQAPARAHGPEPSHVGPVRTSPHPSSRNASPPPAGARRMSARADFRHPGVAPSCGPSSGC